MSVKRYEYRHGELSDEHYNHPPAGEFVRWEDYARLKAEVERMTQIVNSPHPSTQGWVLACKERDALKAEVEMLKSIILAQSSDFVCSRTSDDGIKPDGHNDLARRAVERCLELKAEVERLEGLVKYWQIEAETDHARWLRVLEEVERLRKAGDAMCKFFDDHGFYGFGFQEAWNSAKDGEQL